MSIDDAKTGSNGPSSKEDFLGTVLALYGTVVRDYCQDRLEHDQEADKSRVLRDAREAQFTANQRSFKFLANLPCRSHGYDSDNVVDESIEQLWDTCAIDE